MISRHETLTITTLSEVIMNTDKVERPMIH